MRVVPYLYFNGRCEEAVDFYRERLGATVMVLTRYRDNPGAPAPAGAGSKIMHAGLKIGDSTIFASDGQGQGDAEFRGFSLSLAATTDADAERIFAALASDGQVRFDLQSTPFATRFGILADRFGVNWVVSTAP